VTLFKPAARPIFQYLSSFALYHVTPQRIRFSQSASRQQRLDHSELVNLHPQAHHASSAALAASSLALSWAGWSALNHS
jgi:hypothetical protein